MLRKLMKYELKATGRVMLPLYLAVVALAAVLRGLAVWSQALHYDAVTGFDPVRVLLTLVTAAFFLALVAAPIAAHYYAVREALSAFRAGIAFVPEV